jgi:hypothetical protein
MLRKTCQVWRKIWVWMEMSGLEKEKREGEAKGSMRTGSLRLTPEKERLTMIVIMIIMIVLHRL